MVCMSMQGRLIDQVVQDLHRLQLEQTGSPEPGENDVLRHLAVGTGGRSDRCGGRAAEERKREIDVGVGRPEPGGRQIEDPGPGFPFVDDPAEENIQRERGQGCGDGGRETHSRE